jgi:peptidylprolyl isomerase
VKIIIAALVVLACVFYFNSKNKAASSENKKKGEAFLANNSQQEGVETTASGLQYKVLTKGEGDQHPKASDRVKVHYHGTLIDGKVFDSSVDRGEPISFGLKQVIKGWTEGLQLMVVGDKYRLFIPSGLGYGNKSAGDIGPGSVLIFDVELLGINE